MRWLCVLVIACSSSKPPTTTNGAGSGAPPPAVGTCDQAKPKIEALYRAEATANKETPERTAEAVSDNTTMVMAECAKAPAKIAACIERSATAAELEKQCLAPLDDEGTEGEALRK